MNNEKCRLLIQLHGAKDLLWNSKSPHYHNKSLRQDVWNEISAILELPTPDLRRKWLRFRRPIEERNLGWLKVLLLVLTSTTQNVTPYANYDTEPITPSAENSAGKQVEIAKDIYNIPNIPSIRKIKKKNNKY
ncbi:unnamed protein product [Ceutorhynchus assimilis]|uniref:MADF domain-containing protein n=1 Tax=Ceutorhynchus assimilis TaxID=467358 RepID=A0A9N9MDJ5_9CUCU|nr:unnamed protein product [Ceutorhynchus assimilis]